MTSAKPLTLMFKDDGAVPNNPSMPALLYKARSRWGAIRKASLSACSLRTAGATGNGATASIRSRIIIR